MGHVSGAELDPKQVYMAQKEEIQLVRDMKLYGKVTIAECWEKTSKARISTKWIDVSKGDQTTPEYRSRNVAREIARSKNFGVFPATPPAEVMKLLLSALKAGNTGERLMIADMKRAFFNTKVKRTTDVRLHLEVVRPGEEGMCGLVNFLHVWDARRGGQLVR